MHHSSATLRPNYHRTLSDLCCARPSQPSFVQLPKHAAQLGSFIHKPIKCGPCSMPYHPSTCPSERGSEPPQSAPVRGSRRMICPRPNTMRAWPAMWAVTACPRFLRPSTASSLKPSSSSTLEDEQRLAALAGQANDTAIACVIQIGQLHKVKAIKCWSRYAIFTSNQAPARSLHCSNRQACHHLLEPRHPRIQESH